MNSLTKKLLIVWAAIAVALFVTMFFTNEAPNIAGPIIGFGGLVWLVLLVFIIFRSLYLRLNNDSKKGGKTQIEASNIGPTKRDWKEICIILLIFPIIPILILPVFIMFNKFSYGFSSLEIRLLIALCRPAVLMIIAMFFCISRIKKWHRAETRSVIKLIFLYLFAVGYALGLVSLPFLYLLGLLAEAAG